MMIGIGTPTSQRSALRAIVASVIVSDNGATKSRFLVLLIERRLPHKERGPPKRGDPLVNYDRSRWGKGIERSHKERSKQLHVP